MATRVVVTVKGLLGLDDPARLLRELEAETGLAWHEESVDRGRVLGGGLEEILLTAAVGKTAEIAIGAAMERAKQVVGRWREERLDPPETSVVAEYLLEVDAAGAVDTADAEELEG